VRNPQLLDALSARTGVSAPVLADFARIAGNNPIHSNRFL
jgi:hypothetical protein